MSELFAVLDKYWRDNAKAMLIQGIVQSVRGATASVFLSGSGQAVEAWYGKGTDVVAGDRVMLIRAERDNKWVIVAAYGTEQTGHSSLTPPAPVEQIAADATKGFALGTLGGIAVTGVNSSRQIASVGLICSKDGTILTGASFYIFASTMTPNIVRLVTLVDGTEIGDSGSFFATTSEDKQSLTTILPYRVGAGRHTVSWQVNPGGGVMDVLIRNAWAIEV